MKKSIIISVILGLAIIWTLGILINKNSQPRILTYNTSSTEQISLVTDPSPLRLGQASFILSIKDRQGNQVDNASVFFDLNMMAMNMGTQQGVATAQGNGRYAAAGRLTMAGPWRVAVKVTMPDGQVINKDFDVNVR